MRNPNPSLAVQSSNHRRKGRLARFFQNFYLILIYLFMYAPIAILIIYSFNASANRGTWAGFSLEWYKSLFSNSALLEAMYNTIIVAVLAALISTVLGTAAAIAIQHMKKAPQTLVMQCTYLPVLNPDIVTGVALMMLFLFVQLKFGLLTLLLAHISFCTPYVILSVLPKLQQLRPNLYEAALDLGAKPFYAFRKVVLPEIMPGIITGAIFAFTLSLDDFVISYFTTGNGVQNLSIAVYAMARKGVSPEVNALSTLMFIVVLVLLLVINRRSSKEAAERDKNRL